MSMDSSCGIVHNAGVQNGEILVHLPLEQVLINVLIIDISARVTLTQTFVNSEHATSRAVYHFPVPASAAICAFEMRLGDGRMIKGVSKDNKDAAEQFEKAVQAGREASLLKWITDDSSSASFEYSKIERLMPLNHGDIVFTISIGSIPAFQTVETKLVYVMDLMNENVDQIRFHLPMYVGERYGELPQDLVASSQPSSGTRIKINIDVQTSGRILNIDSPTHADEIEISQYPTHLNRPSRRRARVKYRSESFLNRDFVLIVEAERLDSPRCFAELEGDPDRKASLALQLAVVPKFHLVSNRAQEYIFVVDRSGSMQNTRIETAKRTLGLLLRMLPQNNTFFNIVSFGTATDNLWSDSQMYTQHTLNVATSTVDRMEANFGGTEIFNALRAVLSSRRSDIATVIFLLTDGESHDIDSTTRLVRNAADSAPSSAPLHVYVLGIGDASTAMCEGIAIAGKGVCLFAHQAESIMSKCARLLRAGRTPFVKNVTVDWGLSNEYLASASNSVTFSASSSSQRTRLRSFPVLQQAPTKIDDIHAGIRFTVYAILRLKRIAVPEEVILRGNLDDTGEAFTWRVPIRGVQLTDSEPGLPTIHTLAAWRMIQEHDLGRAPLPQHMPVPGTSPSDEELHTAAIIRLGETYQLVSRHTSFVATEQEQRTARAKTRRSFDFGNWARGIQTSIQGSTDAAPSSPLAALYSSVVSGLGSLFAATTASIGMPGAWPEDSPSSSGPDPRADSPEDGYESSDSVRTFTTLSSILGLGGSGSDWSDMTEPTSSPISGEIQPSSEPQFVPARFAPSHIPPPVSGPPVEASLPAPPPLLPIVVDLVKEQQFDGSYPLDDHLRTLVGDRAFNEFRRLGIDETAWSTALAVAYITQQMGNRKELLDDVVYKSLDYLRSGGNEQLIQRATSLIMIV
ncbi:hypothetical protein D9757_002171 [Collybiopsis confluens]|uniref:Uncharacterized protein n=1 Tax=Collybiopsis confluens TaxID=2823264 RepID=A0A8H5I007_9AGAR|nr:hypothetical protein D9757_002171 [Collybiopsis confluens]